MTLREEAEKLNISVHTLKNWQKRQESRQDEILTSRANKLNSSRRMLPRELLGRADNRNAVSGILDKLDTLPLTIEAKLLYFVLHFLAFKRLAVFPALQASETTLAGLITGLECPAVLIQELQLRLGRLPEEDQNSKFPDTALPAGLFPPGLNAEEDLPGLIYQGLRREGQRSRQGAWFTPPAVIDSMIREHRKKAAGLFDPCCGSGLFLCRFAELRGSAEGICGMDLDPMAVFLSRVNLFVRFPCMEDLSVVWEGNSLGPEPWTLKPGILVATNPPWGAHMASSDKKKMRKRYPEISSGETASLFIRRCIEELPEKGRAAFLLPESLCYVQTHKDLREYLLKKAPPVRMEHRERLFQGVYSRVFSCEIIKGGRQRKCSLPPGEPQPLSRYKKNPAFIFNILCSNSEARLIEKIRKKRGLKIPKQSQWLLGVVTGDNGRFVTTDPDAPGSPLLTGKEIHPFRYDSPRCRLKTGEGPLQQSRQLDEYRQPKLVYRFIGNTPVFALDREGVITLNSANGLVLPDPEMMEEAALWFNSSLFRFIWQKQFSSVKMLRFHLEFFPLPLWKRSEKSLIKGLVQKAEKGQDISSPADELVFRHFELTKEERDIVLSFKGN